MRSVDAKFTFAFVFSFVVVASIFGSTVTGMSVSTGISTSDAIFQEYPVLYILILSSIFGLGLLYVGLRHSYLVEQERL